MAAPRKLDSADLLRRLRARRSELTAQPAPADRAAEDAAASLAPAGPGIAAVPAELTARDVATMSLPDVEATAEVVSGRIEGTLIETYRHLRLVMVAAAPAILVAIATVWNAGYAGLPSISHYYYTPARIVFVGALVTAAAALLALSGRGAQRGWLDLAALFAPLIALVPTRIANGEVPGWDAVCPSDTECIPAEAYASIATGVAVWFVFAVLVIGYGVLAALLRRTGRDALAAQVPRSARATWTPLVAGAVIVVVAAIAWIWARETFLDRAHFVSASLFFVIITIVALGQARRMNLEPDPSPPAGWWHRLLRRLRREIAWLPRIFTTFPGWIAFLLAADIVTGLLVLLLDLTAPITIGERAIGTVFLVEAVALALFTVFWGFETVRKWNEADPD